MRLPFFKKRGDRAVDPVCDMQVDVNRPPGGSYEYNGETYYFCGPGCNRGVSAGAGGVFVRRKEDEDVVCPAKPALKGGLGKADGGPKSRKLTPQSTKLPWASWFRCYLTAGVFGRA